MDRQVSDPCRPANLVELVSSIQRETGACEVCQRFVNLQIYVYLHILVNFYFMVLRLVLGILTYKFFHG